MRDRLIELLKKTVYRYQYQDPAEAVADYLLANGVIVPPVKVGDKYYTIQRYCNTDPWENEKEPVHPWDCEKYCGRDDCSFREYRIEEHHFGSIGFILRVEKNIGKTVFLTREEAEQALKGGAGYGI